MFRQWSAPPSSESDPEIARLDAETARLRQQIHDLREFGRQKRLNRLQALDALETRRITLTEILRRMEKELEDTDVYKYGDVLAEVFGERKIYAHRAIGLESLLCQFMHQMLARQHQLKIIKKSAKDIQSRYKKHKLLNKNEFHSYEALAVQAEASRLSLEAIYDDIFASQHRIFAMLNQGAAGTGTITNYSMPTGRRNMERKASLRLSTKYPVSREDYEGAQTPDADASQENDDFETAMDILSNRDDLEEVDIDTAQHEDEKKDPGTSEADAGKPRKSLSSRDGQNGSKLASSPTRSQSETIGDSLKSSPDSAKTSRRTSESSYKTARERRREIEHLRHARVVGGARNASSSSSLDIYDEDENNLSARERMRELETKRQSLSSPVEVDDDSKQSSQEIANETEEEKKHRERRERRKERASRKYSKPDIGYD